MIKISEVFEKRKSFLEANNFHRPVPPKLSRFICTYNYQIICINATMVPAYKSSKMRLKNRCH